MKVNIIGIILFVTGIIIIIYGVVGAYISISELRSIDMAGEPSTHIDWTSFFMMISSPLTYGMVLIGVSEIIRILHKQYHHATKTDVNNLTEKPNTAIETESIPKKWTISETDEEKIYELYSNQAILEIIPSQKEGYCIIKLQDKEGPLNPYIKIADVSGLGASEVHDETIRQEIMDWYEDEGYQN